MTRLDIWIGWCRDECDVKYKRIRLVLLLQLVVEINFSFHTGSIGTSTKQRTGNDLRTWKCLSDTMRIMGMGPQC
jgi:hypothetical protein